MRKNTMIKKLSRFIMLVILPLALVLGCGELGKVDQGRVIAYDKEAGTVTLIRDLKADPGKPDYSSLPPHIYVLPKAPQKWALCRRQGTG